MRGGVQETRYSTKYRMVTFQNVARYFANKYKDACKKKLHDDNPVNVLKIFLPGSLNMVVTQQYKASRNLAIRTAYMKKQYLPLQTLHTSNCQHLLTVWRSVTLSLRGRLAINIIKFGLDQATLKLRLEVTTRFRFARLMKIFMCICLLGSFSTQNWRCEVTVIFF
jgi:hypothetical protein